jgi:Ca2+-binding RTX toxin-like protein
MFFSSILFLRYCGGELSCSIYKDSCWNSSPADKLNEFYSGSKMLFLTVEAKMSTIVPLTSAPGVTTLWEAFAQTNNNLACWGYTPTIVGMPGSDNRVGTPGQYIVVTLGCDDSVRVQGGYYFICGGPGNDNLRSGDSDDMVGGYSGDDNIFGGAGYDLLTSNDGDDKLWAAMIMTTYMMVQISTMVMEDRAPISAMKSRL